MRAPSPPATAIPSRRITAARRSPRVRSRARTRARHGVEKEHRSRVLSAKATFFFLRYQRASWAQKASGGVVSALDSVHTGRAACVTQQGTRLGGARGVSQSPGASGCVPGNGEWVVNLYVDVSGPERGSEGKRREVAPGTHCAARTWRGGGVRTARRRGLGAAAGGVGAVDAGDDWGASTLLARECVMRERASPFVVVVVAGPENRK